MKKALFFLITSVLLVGCAYHDSLADPGGHRGAGLQDERRIDPPPHQKTEPPPGAPGFSPPLRIVLIEIGLDEEQKKAVRKIEQSLMKEMIGKQSEEKIAEIELRDMLEKDEVDMKSVETKIRQIEAIRAGMRLASVRATEEVKTKLTQEQKEQFLELMERPPFMKPPFDGDRLHERRSSPYPFTGYHGVREKEESYQGS